MASVNDVNSDDQNGKVGDDGGTSVDLKHKLVGANDGAKKKRKRRDEDEEESPKFCDLNPEEQQEIRGQYAIYTDN